MEKRAEIIISQEGQGMLLFVYEGGKWKCHPYRFNFFDEALEEALAQGVPLEKIKRIY